MKAGLSALVVVELLFSFRRQYLIFAVNKRRVNCSEVSLCRVDCGTWNGQCAL